MPSWKKVIISGSAAELSSLYAPSITGSLLGTASWAQNSVSATNASDILIYVKNTSGAQINKGTVVRISGAIGDNALIATASYTDDANSANTLGITREDIANDAFGYVMTEGTLLGISTDLWTAGQLLYLGANGSITGSAPLAPLHAVRLGQVLRVQQNVGSMYVRIDNGYEIGELHDVRDTSTTASYGDLLVKSGSVWINSTQLTGSYGLTGSLSIAGNGVNGLILSADLSNTTRSSRLFFGQQDTASYNAIYAASGSMFFSTAANVGTTSGATRMFISSSGNVGIGTTNPNLGLLHVGGTIYAASAITGSGLMITGSTSTDLVRITQLGSGNAFVVEDSSNPDSSPFVIDANGNVGMGTLTPQTVLHIKSNPATSGLAMLRLDSSGSTLNSSISYYSGDVNRWEVGTGISKGAAYEIYDRVASKTRFSITTSGNSLFENGNVLISGSLTVGTSSIGASENTLTLGAQDNGSEGGQLGLNAPGGTYTSASMIDNYQNLTRLLRGTNASSDAVVAQWNMHTKQMQLPAYNSSTAFTGTAAGYLAFDSSGNILTTAGVAAGAAGSDTQVQYNSGGALTGTNALRIVNATVQMSGSVGVTGSLTATNSIIAQANGAMYFRGGDDVELWDINVANTIGIYGQQNSQQGAVKLGSSGPTLHGSGSRLGIATTTPVATLDVNGNLFVASGITGSLQGTASISQTASFVNPLNQTLVLTGSARITGSVGITGSLFVTGSTSLVGVGIAPNSNYGVYIRSVGTVAGLRSETSFGDEPGTSIQGITTTNLLLGGIGTGVYGSAGPATGDNPAAEYLGGDFIASSTFGTAYSVRLRDGSEAAGKVLVSQTSDGKANWSTQLSGSYGLTGSLSIGQSLNASTTATANIGSTTIYSVSTSSYDGAWFEYTARSGSNARAGQIMSIWSGSSVNFTETTTTDFGSTSGLSLGVFIVNGAMALTASAATAGWSIKTIVRSI